MEKKYGFPIVNADNIFEILERLRIKKWPHTQPPMDLNGYAAGKLTEEQKEEVRRFAPKSEVVFLRDPNGNSFIGFRSVGKNWVSIFTILEDSLLPIVAEFKHGAEAISIGFPSGAGRREAEFKDSMSACAKREFEEETGIKLQEVILLSGPEGIPISGRQSTQRFFPFLGVLPKDLICSQSKLDRTEFLQVVLIPLKEWIRLIEQGKVTEDSSISLTFLALRQLGRLKIE